MLLHVIPHNCSEKHRIVAIPDYSLMGLGMDVIARVNFDNLGRFPIWMASIGKATKPCQQTSGCWLLTLSLTLTWEMIRIRNFYWLIYRQHTCLTKWEVIVGDMIDHVGIYGSRVGEGLSPSKVGLGVCFVLRMCLYLMEAIDWYIHCKVVSSFCLQWEINYFNT